ncbi:MAG TPA: Crp/Fnr family transcriptional regulator [Abditibacteriaceae bacterium]|jgi:CRP-like cAMP-binding protein
MQRIDSSSGSSRSKRPSNKILEALPESEYQQLLPHFTKVSLQPGQILHHEGEVPQYAYFLLEGIASLTVSTDEGKDLGLSMVGSEGIVGERAIFEGGLPMVRCMMLTRGISYAVGPQILNEGFHEGGKLHDLVMRSLEARLAETSQTALCNQMHSIEQRLSRWLLTLADRLGHDQIPVTQELIADVLGVRRSGVTVAAGALREAGLIEYSRGCINILDRKGMEEQACECYHITKDAVERAYRNPHATSTQDSAAAQEN